MRITTLDKTSSVENLATYGNDTFVWRVARTCTGNGFEGLPENRYKLERFLYNLLKLRHMRCFEFCGIVFGIRCPIFVERQLRTYRKPDLERSLRSCDPIERLQENESDDPITRAKHAALRTYWELRQKGVKKEEARRVLPLDTLTEFVSFYSLRSLLHVFDERLAPPAQSETSQIVNAMSVIARAYFPITIACYERLKNENESETK